MSDEKGSGDPPERENLAGLWTAQDVSVTEAKSEPPTVAMARLKYKTIEFSFIAMFSLIAALVAIFFLGNIYDKTTNPDVEGRIVVGLLTVISSAVGVFVGRASAK
jgi:hypothetical protein